MFTRKLFKWNVTLASQQTAATVERIFEAYWSPDKVELGEIAAACAAQETVAAKHKPVYLPVSAELVAG